MVERKNEKPIVIGFCGNAGHGKDTAAGFAQKAVMNLGINARLFSLADPLKETVSDLLGIPLCMFYTEEGKKAAILGTNKTNRDALVEISKAIKVFDPYIWIKKAYLKAMEVRDDTEVVSIIPDFRSDTEASYFRDSAQITLIRVIRDNPPYPPETYENEMEKSVEGIRYDYLLRNNGTVEDLQRDVEALIQTWYRTRT